VDNSLYTLTPYPKIVSSRWTVDNQLCTACIDFSISHT